MGTAGSRRRGATDGASAAAGTWERCILVVPLYIYPNVELYARVGKTADVVIVNPSNGNGAVHAPNEDWAPALDALGEVRCFGYVHTQYGRRDLALVKKELDGYATLWRKWVSGLFVDEVAGHEDDYNLDLCTYALEKGLNVILNPGVPAPNLFALPGVEAVVQHEGPQMPTVAFQRPDKSMAIVHSQRTPAELPRLRAMARYIYLTNSSAYHTELPPYFEALQSNTIL